MLVIAIASINHAVDKPVQKKKRWLRESLSYIPFSSKRLPVQNWLPESDDRKMDCLLDSTSMVSGPGSGMQSLILGMIV
jgi:hypothetical protein